MAVPPVLSDLVSAPTLPTGADEREDRRSKFHEVPDKLHE
jgi:hypothetical protein